MRGTIKWFNAQKGYGFITAEDGTEVFAHYSQIKMNGFKSLDADDVVEFDIRSEDKGLAAVDIVPVLALRMMKQKAAEENLHLEVAQANESGEKGMSLEELDEYFKE